MPKYFKQYNCGANRHVRVYDSETGKVSSPLNSDTKLLLVRNPELIKGVVCEESAPYCPTKSFPRPAPTEENKEVESFEEVSDPWEPVLEERASVDVRREQIYTSYVIEGREFATEAAKKRAATLQLKEEGYE